MKSGPQPPAQPLSTREVVLRGIENMANRSGPEVVTALNKSLGYFEDLALAQGEMAQLCYIPSFQQGLYSYVANTGNPEIDVQIERCARSSAKSDARLVKSDEEYESGQADHIALQLLALERKKVLGLDANLRHPPALLQRRMTLESLQILTQKAANEICDPSDITVEMVPGSLKKLRSFRILFRAGPLLTLRVILEFDGRAIWSDAVFLSKPGMQLAPIMTFQTISPASDFAWPVGMATEIRIACFLRAMALFARQIARQNDQEGQAEAQIQT